MDKQESTMHFNLMSLTFKIRDFFSPRKNIVKEVGIKPGFHVLDYGCGPGSYIVPLAKLVGESGKIYALDILPRAIQKVRRIAEEKHLSNVETIRSDCRTVLTDGSVDTVLVYDALHEVKSPDSVLEELHRVLKQDGILSVSDHHMNEDELLAAITNGKLFTLSKKGKKTYSFTKL